MSAACTGQAAARQAHAGGSLSFAGADALKFLFARQVSLEFPLQIAAGRPIPSWPNNMHTPRSWSAPPGSTNTSTTPTVRIVESDEDVLLYQVGHVPGAVKIDWHTDLQDQIVRDYIDKDRFAELCASKGIANDTTVVFYGDKNNWWACYAFWVFKLYGHADCRIMNGGRKRWEARRPRPGRASPSRSIPGTNYVAQDADLSIRAFRDEVLKHQRAGKPLVDVRSPGEYTGELLHMADYPQEGALRGGHIPGAVNVPWSRAANEDGTFKSPRTWKSSTRARPDLKRRAPVSPIAASASGRATPGSCCTTCWAFPRSRTTTARGPSGATPWACRSKRAWPSRPRSPKPVRSGA